jgi:D-glycero-D-manno-heptose 1,7-bisphosphate phosphatase
MLRQAERELGLDLRRSWVVGDRDLDVGLAHAVGARGALVRSGYGETALAAGPAYPPDHVAEDALTAVEWILAREVQP